ncbi:hypothetical protein A0128_07970 [Leptospira tipperaryensis]|uniref:Metallo-beta-lactamase domain-containing protein n=1 Tax=Leptospira tipperaryensis TaxID=2564040 RepID=A0A1D7UW62_9LEPT|nr:MBL fold metallo-hydrolase [Leptospira tipperaryensis]AOP33784.1 hypothetical protein A0128_07970 [Leptospira tipperaryensis]
MKKNKKVIKVLKAIRWISIVTLFSACIFSVYTCMSLTASSEREARIKASPNWKDGQFVNPQPLINDVSESILSLFRKSEFSSPIEELNVHRPEPSLYDVEPASGMRVTWFGHSSTLVEIDGYKILTDPIWSDRSSPVTWAGPKRWYAPPLSFEDLPKIDVVVISHDHYDHLDYKTTLALNEKGVVFIVPLGVGKHLSHWGILESKIVELDWWESFSIRELKIVATPARHASGRILLDKDEHLWAGYALIGAKHRLYYSGDTGLFPAMKDIGEKYGPFDLTMIETGQYNQAWPDWHIGPEQAVIAHKMVRGKSFLPVHWALFELAAHGWTEPIERVLVKAKEMGVNVFTPKPGQSFEPEASENFSRWWPDLPWKTAAEDPIRSTQMN